MRFIHIDRKGRRPARPEAERNPGASHPDHRHHGRRRGRRPFDYGQLRLLVLAMIAEQPRHGYELMKAIEERMEGRYSPSPGVIYPTLAWLEEMGLAAQEAAEAARKRYRITPEGEAYLAAHRAEADALLERLGDPAAQQVPDLVLRAMDRLKHSLRLRLRRSPLDPGAAAAIALALEAAADAVEDAT